MIRAILRKGRRVAWCKRSFHVGVRFPPARLQGVGAVAEGGWSRIEQPLRENRPNARAVRPRQESRHYLGAAGVLAFGRLLLRMRKGVRHRCRNGPQGAAHNGA